MSGGRLFWAVVVATLAVYAVMLGGRFRRSRMRPAGARCSTCCRRATATPRRRLSWRPSHPKAPTSTSRPASARPDRSGPPRDLDGLGDGPVGAALAVATGAPSGTDPGHGVRLPREPGGGGDALGGRRWPDPGDGRASQPELAAEGDLQHAVARPAVGTDPGLGVSAVAGARTLRADCDGRQMLVSLGPEPTEVRGHASVRHAHQVDHARLRRADLHDDLRIHRPAGGADVHLRSVARRPGRQRGRPQLGRSDSCGSGASDLRSLHPDGGKFRAWSSLRFKQGWRSSPWFWLRVAASWATRPAPPS